MLWFVSDTHFNHKKIIELCQRPFDSIDEMNQAIIDNWNSVVGKHDDVYHLGDFAFHHKDDTMKMDEIFYALNGIKYLIVGNHDEQNSKVLRLPWKSVQHYAHVRYGEARFVMSHFPFERWWHMEKKQYTIHVHGHCHGSAPEKAHRFDAGSDPQEFFPVNAEELIREAAVQKFNHKDYYIHVPTSTEPTSV